MGSSNKKAHLASKRLRPNQNATGHAKIAATDTIGHDNRQAGAHPPVQERHLDHTQTADRHQSQNQRQQQHNPQSSGQVSVPASQSIPAADAAKATTESPQHVGRPHNQRQGAARGTRSGCNNEIVTAFEWEALTLAKNSKNSDFSSAAGIGSQATTLLAADNMSRNRPRGPPLPRDNGLAANEETDMWNKILQDLRKAKEKNDKQKSLAEQIAALNEKMGKEAGSWTEVQHLLAVLGKWLDKNLVLTTDAETTLSNHNELDGLFRQMAKLCEEERAILLDEPSDVVKNLGLLTALRQASEAEAPLNRTVSLSKSSRKKRSDLDGPAESPGPPAPSNSEKVSRVKGAVPRSGSVSSTQAREGREGREGREVKDNVAVKVEEGTESTKGTIAERSGQLVIGAEVVFKHNKNKQGVEGEGIQCIIKNITGEGPKKRYDVQDPEPNENGEQGAVYKTTAASLIPIPHVGSSSPSFPPGKQVLARYPDTTTFYRAEVTGSRKEVYRLKFEGEEDDKEMEVDKRFVLDIPGK